MKSLIKFAAPLVAFGAISLTSAAASADVPCWVRHVPGSTNFGSNGYTTTTVYSLPNCQGTFVGSYNLCTAGATSISCAASSSYRYSEAALLAQTQMLRAAMLDGGKVAAALNTCNAGGGSSCLAFFYYDPK